MISTNRIFVHAYYVAYKFYNKEREIIQAAQNDTDGACMVQEESCMTKEEILSGFDKKASNHLLLHIAR